MSDEAPKHSAGDGPRDHVLSNEAYDITKYLALIVLPALGTLYFALAQIWGLPNAQEVVGSIMAVDAFLGVVLRISSQSYDNSDAKFDGVVNVEEQPSGKKVMDLELTRIEDPNEIADRDHITFKVNKHRKE